MANQSYRRSKHHRSKKTLKIAKAYEVPIDPQVWEKSIEVNRGAFPDADELFDRLDNADPGTGLTRGKK